MRKKKGTRPDVGASERAKETGQASRQTTTSNDHDTTTNKPGQGLRVADFLARGQQNAIPLKHLKDLLHLNGRKVRLMIRAERLSGTPILESSKATGGYFLPSTPGERARCVQRLRRRAAEIVKVADAIEGAAGCD